MRTRLTSITASKLAHSSSFSLRLRATGSSDHGKKDRACRIDRSELDQVFANIEHTESILAVLTGGAAAHQCSAAKPLLWQRSGDKSHGCYRRVLAFCAKL